MDNNMLNNVFFVAIRKKYRFPYHGQISVEDLWDLSVDALNTIFRTLNSELKRISEDSLLNTTSKEEETLRQKIEIIRSIVEVKLNEKLANEIAAKRAAQKQKILKMIEEKKDEALKNMTIEQLEALLS